MGRKEGDFEEKLYVRIGEELKKKIKDIKENSNKFNTEADLIRHLLEQSTRANVDIPKSRIKVYDPSGNTLFDLSRSSVELFIDCPRCFVLHKKKGVPRPGGFPFTLNMAVDSLLKKEFDTCRQQQKPHPKYQINLHTSYGEPLNCIPYQHESLNDWRNNFRGIQYEHPLFRLRGAPDDIWWEVSREELIIVDYKATSTQQLKFDKPWHASYKRQLEFYQYLFRKNGFRVSDIAFILYANAIKQLDGFNETLNFEVEPFDIQGNTDWIEDVLQDIKNALDQNEIPLSSKDCNYCKHSEQVSYLNLF